MLLSRSFLSCTSTHVCSFVTYFHRIYNLPENKLGKNALTLARDIIEKRKEILPTGHIPENQQQATQMGDADYWDSYPYLKKIKVSANNVDCTEEDDSPSLCVCLTNSSLGCLL